MLLRNGLEHMSPAVEHRLWTCGHADPGSRPSSAVTVAMGESLTSLFALQVVEDWDRSHGQSPPHRTLGWDRG